MKIHASSENESDIAAITEILAATPVGSVATYAMMSAALGAPVQARRYLALQAIARVNAESGAVFGNVRGEGYKRLAGDETHMIGSQARRRIRGTAKRAAAFMSRSLEAANDLPPTVQRKVVAEIATLAMIRHITKERVVKALATHNKPPPVAESFRGVLALFGVVKP